MRAVHLYRVVTCADMYVTRACVMCCCTDMYVTCTCVLSCMDMYVNDFLGGVENSGADEYMVFKPASISMFALHPSCQTGNYVGLLLGPPVCYTQVFMPEPDLFFCRLLRAAPVRRRHLMNCSCPLCRPGCVKRRSTDVTN